MPYGTTAEAGNYAALEKAQSKLWKKVRRGKLPPFDHERCVELMKAETLQEYEDIRSNWAELAEAMQAHANHRP